MSSASIAHTWRWPLKSTGMLVGISLMAVLVTVGCQQGEQDRTVIQDDQVSTIEPAPLPEPLPVLEEQTVSGQVTKVDMDARTITVAAADAEHVITFSDVTAVTGTAGAQGLAGQEGTRVNVRYREDQGTKLASSIEIVNGQPVPGS